MDKRELVNLVGLELGVQLKNSEKYFFGILKSISDDSITLSYSFSSKEVKIPLSEIAFVKKLKDSTEFRKRFEKVFGG